MATRRSHRRLADPGPDPTELTEILRAGVSGPDHGRFTPWRYVTFVGEQRRDFGTVIAHAAQRREPDITPERLAVEQSRLERAPVVIAAGAHVEANEKIRPAEQVAAVAAGVQNMLLAATAMGYGSIWRTGWVCVDPEVKAALGLRSQDELVGFIYLGSVVEAPPPRAEPSLDSVVRSWRGL